MAKPASPATMKNPVRAALRGRPGPASQELFSEANVVPSIPCPSGTMQLILYPRTNAVYALNVRKVNLIQHNLAPISQGSHQYTTDALCFLPKTGRSSSMALAAGLDLTLPFLPTVDTWAQIAASLLFLFATGVIIRALWLGYTKPDLAPHSAPVAPFLVIDSLGTLKNAERGFAQMLVARMDELQGRVDKSIKVLEQAGAADKLTKPPSEHDNPFEPDAEPNSKLIRIVLESKVISPVEPPLELKFQGLDLTGVFSWVTTQVGPKTDSLRFTAHVDSEGIAIAGNIRALSLDGPSTIWIDPVKGAAAAIDELALQLYHLSLKKSNAYLGDFSSADFRKLI